MIPLCSNNVETNPWLIVLFVFRYAFTALSLCLESLSSWKGSCFPIRRIPVLHCGSKSDSTFLCSEFINSDMIVNITGWNTIVTLILIRFIDTKSAPNYERVLQLAVDTHWCVLLLASSVPLYILMKIWTRNFTFGFITHKTSYHWFLVQYLSNLGYRSLGFLTFW